MTRPMKKAIFLFDYTGIMAKPWIEAGYDCYIFDGQHPKGVTTPCYFDSSGRRHDYTAVGMWFDPRDKLISAKAILDLVGEGVEFVFGFPECTDLTVAGAKHFKSKRDSNPLFQLEAIELADLVRCVGVLCDAAWAFENPVSVISTQYRRPDFKFNPCDYGGYLPEVDEHPLYPGIYPPRDAYNKGTCIWCGNGYKIPKPKKIEPLYKDNPGWKHCGGKSLKTKNIRSATPRGFSIANFEANSL